MTEASQYQYTYESDGQTVTATAIGDLDCDGNPGVFTMTGRIEDGQAVVTITSPKGVR